MSQDNNLPKIGAPATRALQGIGITELKQLTRVTELEGNTLMDKTVRTHLDNIRSEDGQVQDKAYSTLNCLT